MSPSFSSLNGDATVNGIPGLNRRSVDTTVDLREGQWLAIAGLIQEEQGGNRSGLPYLGTLPRLGGLFGRHNTTRNETELIVLVSPELVHPMEPDQVPLRLPGMEVTDPTDADFFHRNLIEGFQDNHYRSTVWPEMSAQLKSVMRSADAIQCDIQQEYVCGPVDSANRISESSTAMKLLRHHLEAVLVFNLVIAATIPGCKLPPPGIPVEEVPLGSVVDEANRTQEENAQAGNWSFICMSLN